MDSKFKIFLSGGITGLSDDESSKWREAICDFYSSYENCIIVNPVAHFNPNGCTSDSEEKEGMEFCLSHLRTSDFVIVNLNKLDSIGTAQELMLAYELHIPIIGIAKESTLENIHPWIKAEAIRIFTYANNIHDVLSDVIVYVSHHYIAP